MFSNTQIDELGEEETLHDKEFFLEGITVQGKKGTNRLKWVIGVKGTNSKLKINGFGFYRIIQVKADLLVIDFWA